MNLVGLSVFHPDAETLRSLGAHDRFDLDLPRRGENILWIGRPDYRYAIPTMFPYSFLIIIALFAFAAITLRGSDPDFAFRFTVVCMSADFVMLLFGLFAIATSIDTTYYITDSQLIVKINKSILSNMNVYGRVALHKGVGDKLMFDLKVLDNIVIRTFPFSCVGNIIFNSSIDMFGNVISRSDLSQPLTHNNRKTYFVSNFNRNSVAFGLYSLRDAESVGALLLAAIDRRRDGIRSVALPR
jgi:hypothetical protein